MTLCADLQCEKGFDVETTIVWDYADHRCHRGLSDRRASGAVTPIAVVGIDCRFPGAPDKDAFWRLLMDGVVTDTEVPSQRWDIDTYYHPDGVAGIDEHPTRPFHRRRRRIRQRLFRHRADRGGGARPAAATAAAGVVACTGRCRNRSPVAGRHANRGFRRNDVQRVEQPSDARLRRGSPHFVARAAATS